jgi:hypothetical protein
VIPYQGDKPGLNAAGMVLFVCFLMALDVVRYRPELLPELRRWLIHTLGLAH